MQNENSYIISIIVMILLLSTILPALQSTMANSNSITVSGYISSPFADEWQYYKMITINHEKVEANLTNFPILISIQDVDLRDKAQSDGDDIAFSDYNGNKLNHEIESYNNSNGNLTAWVNITNISSSTDTIIYMYYGNPTCENQQNIFDVWDKNFVMIQHLNENEETLYDSTYYNNNGIANGTTYNKDCQIDGGRKYNGDEYITVNDFPNLSTALTAEAWVYRDDTTFINIFSKGTHYDTCDWILYLRTQHPGQGIDFGINNHNSNYVRGGSTPQSTWFYLTATYDAGDVILYVNGTEVGNGTITSSIDNNHNVLGLGNNNDGGQPWTGLLDELRVSKVTRNSSWIATSFNTMSDPADFFSLGPEEITSHKPVVNDPYPTDEATDVSIDTSIKVTVSDQDGDIMDVFFYNAEDDSLFGVDENVIDGGRAEVTWYNLDYETTYEWYAVANDSIFETQSDTWSFTTESSTNDPPTVTIIKPNKQIYFRDKPIFSFPGVFIIGHITIEVEAKDNTGIKQVEFYIDGDLKNICTEPTDDEFYSWTWNEKTFLRHTIRVVAVDIVDNISEESNKVFIFNFPRIHPFKP